MVIAIIVNGAFLSDVAIKYLRDHTKEPFIILNNPDFRQNVMNAYNQGIRKMILSTSSNDILNNIDLIQSLIDVMFVSPTSTLSYLRKITSNLYFTTSTSNYLNYVATGFRRFNTCLVYENSDNPYVQETIIIFTNYGIPSFPSNDPSWQQYNVLLLTSTNGDIWNNVVNSLNPDVKYNIYGLEFYSDTPITFPSNVLSVNVIFPQATVTSQITSYWNNLVRYDQFSAGPPARYTYPLLLNSDWIHLASLNLISQTSQTNTYYIARYLPIVPVPTYYNTHNNNIPAHACYIYIVSRQYVDPFSTANIEYIKKVNPYLCKIVETDDLVKSVMKYYKRGTRAFLLNAPSDAIAEVEKLKLRNAFFICTRATSQTVRKPGSPFTFALINNEVQVIDKVVPINNDFNKLLTVVLGTSDNINIPLLKAQLTALGINYINVDDINELPRDRLGLLIVGTDPEYQRVFDFIVNHRDQFPLLASMVRWDGNITNAQYNVLNTTIDPPFSFFNYNSSQPFLSTPFASMSKPWFEPPIFPVLNLSNILYVFSPQFLFNFGYIIDV
jgi:hypothetical protein